MVVVPCTALIMLGCNNAEGQYHSTSFTRTWTVPNDNSGFIAQYDFRYVQDTTQAWESWNQMIDEPVPLAIGEMQTYEMVVPEGQWFVAMKSSDASGNWSERSNIVEVRIDTEAPSTVLDLQ